MRLNINWVLNNEIAVGPGPQTILHIKNLKEKGIVGILSLCSKEELPPPDGIENQFTCKRFILPDHKYNRLITLEELDLALNKLEELIELGPVFVHCVAAVERSPLLCMAWLVKKKNLSVQQSLDYLMQVNRGTCPLPSQLKILRQIKG